MPVDRVPCQISLLAVGLLMAIPAQAQQQRHVERLADDAKLGAQGITATADSPPADSDAAQPKPFKPDLVIVPIPQSSPMLGTGLTLAGVLFYNPNHSAQPWISGVGGMYTSNKSWGVAAFHSMALAGDRIRVLAMGGYADVNVRFYGIGPNAGDRGVSVDIEDKGVLALAQAQYRVAKHVYLGVRLEYLDLDSKIERPNPIFPDLNLPPPVLKSTLATIGPAFTYDSRDNQVNPRRGALLTSTMMFNLKALSSDYSHDKFQASYSTYLPLAPDGVLGLHASACGVSKGGPFFDLCLYGARNDLRGYETGRYRDRASWAAQAEWRQHLGGKFGAVFFAGVGGTAPRLDKIFDQTKLLPSAGMGLRYRASKEAGINLGLDFAIGKDSNAIYFGIGEAF